MEEFDMNRYSEYFCHFDIPISTLPYMTEAVTNMLSDVYDMKYYDKGRWWYGEWEGDRRKVVTLSSPKGNRHINWGWNYNYIPHIKLAGSLAYARTDKSFYADLSDEYLFHMNYHPDKITADEVAYMTRHYTMPVYTGDIEAARALMKHVCEMNMPFIKDYFDSTPDDLSALEEEKRRRTEKPWMFKFHLDGIWTRAFILARHGYLEEAKHIISYEYYSDGYCPENVMKKLCSTAEML